MKKKTFNIMLVFLILIAISPLILFAIQFNRCPLEESVITVVRKVSLSDKEYVVSSEHEVFSISDIDFVLTEPGQTYVISTRKKCNNYIYEIHPVTEGAAQ